MTFFVLALGERRKHEEKCFTSDELHRALKRAVLNPVFTMITVSRGTESTVMPLTMWHRDAGRLLRVQIRDEAYFVEGWSAMHGDFKRLDLPSNFFKWDGVDWVVEDARPVKWLSWNEAAQLGMVDADLATIGEQDTFREGILEAEKDGYRAMVRAEFEAGQHPNRRLEDVIHETLTKYVRDKT